MHDFFVEVVALISPVCICVSVFARENVPDGMTCYVYHAPVSLSVDSSKHLVNVLVNIFYVKLPEVLTCSYDGYISF